MKLTITTTPWYIDDNRVEFRTSYSDGQEVFTKKTILDKEMCKDKNLMRRMLDDMFYEMRECLDKHYAL